MILYQPGIKTLLTHQDTLPELHQMNDDTLINVVDFNVILQLTR